MSFIIYWLSDILFNPMSHVIGGIVGALASLFGLVILFLSPETNPQIYTETHIQQYLAAQPTMVSIFVGILIFSVILIIVGYLRGGLESPIVD